VVLLIPPVLIASWNAAKWKVDAPALRTIHESVSVLVPCRNEERNIDGCIKSIFKQIDDVESILLYDDESSDNTSELLAKIAKANPEKVMIVPTVIKPAGWTGKNHACFQLAANAKSEWLLFLDADARLKTGAITQLLEIAAEKRVSFLSSWPKLLVDSVAEKLLMPLLNLIVFTLFPAPLADSKNYESLGLAHGACILMNRKTYLELGGHETVRDELFEDTMLARLWRRSGHKSACTDGIGIVEVRMYDSFSSIIKGFTKNYYPAFKKQSSFWIFQLWSLLAWTVIPIGWTVTMFYGESGVVSLAPISLSILPRAILAARMRHPMWSTIFNPIANLVALYIGTMSFINWTFNKGVDWKGRHYSSTGSTDNV
jgi:chlorobactene glucosyltransferase